MNIQIKKYGEKHVIISPKDLQKLVELAKKVAPIEVVQELSAEEIETQENTFERKLLAEDLTVENPNNYP